MLLKKTKFVYNLHLFRGNVYDGKYESQLRLNNVEIYHFISYRFRKYYVERTVLHVLRFTTSCDIKVIE